MTTEVVDLLTLGGGAIAGKAFGTVTFLLEQLATARRENHILLMEKFDKEEESMERANKVDGGTWMRRAVYFLVAFSVVSVIVAAWYGQDIYVEEQVQKGFWFWKQSVTEFIKVEGIPFFSMNKTAFLAIVSFYLGKKA